MVIRRSDLAFGPSAEDPLESIGRTWPQALRATAHADPLAARRLRHEVVDADGGFGLAACDHRALVDRALSLDARAPRWRHASPLATLAHEGADATDPETSRGAADEAPGDFGITSLHVPSPLASGAETVQVEYTVRDPDAKVDAVTFELFADGIAAPVWTRVVRGADAADGEHAFAWDGRIVVGEVFPDAYVTLEGSPYRLRARVSGRGRAGPASQSAGFAVTLAELTVSLGPREALREERELAVFDALVSSRSEGATSVVELPSDRYNGNWVGRHPDRAAMLYRELWGDGAKIPLRAEVWVASSHGVRLLAPMAVGRARVLWDYDETPRPAPLANPTAERYVSDARDYLPQDAHPRGGQNCHRDHGGKRSAEALPAVFTVEGLAFASRQTTSRRHALYTEVARFGVDRGRSGVMFRPSRIAGDGYTVRALLDIERSGDAPTPAVLPPSPKGGARSSALAGSFTVSRRLHVARYIRKRAETTPIDLDVAVKAYAQARVNLALRSPDGRPTSPEVMPATNYNERIRAAALSFGRIVSECALAPVDHYASGPWCVTFRPYAEFRAAFAAMQGIRSEAQLDAVLRAKGLGTEALYATECEYLWGWGMLMAVGHPWVESKGITVIHFDRIQPWSHLAQRFSKRENRMVPRPWGGWAAPVNGLGPEGCAIYVLKVGPEADRIVAHELGHHLFLTHAESGTTWSGYPNEHDASDGSCLMSYDPTADHFCGLCVLSLQGWSRTRLSPQSARNRRSAP